MDIRKLFKPGRMWRYDDRGNPVGYASIGGAFQCFPFADAVVEQCIKPLLNVMNSAVYSQPKASINGTRLINFMRTHSDAIVLSSINATEFSVGRNEKGQYVLNEGQFALFRHVWTEDTKTVDVKLKPYYEYLDNILSAGMESSKRLGALTFISPPQKGDLPMSFAKTELEDLEKDIQKKYGSLTDQSSLKIFSKPIKIDQIRSIIPAADIEALVALNVKVICGAFGVPYELVSAAIVGNPNQTGIYQQEAVSRLYSTADAYVNVLLQLAATIGVDINISFPNRPQKNLLDAAKEEEAVVGNLARAVELGYISDVEARKMYRDNYLNEYGN